MRESSRATVSASNGTSSGLRRNALAPARRASRSTSAAESTMIGTCTR